MRKLIVALTIFLSGINFVNATTQDNAFLRCEFGNWNPSYDMVINRGRHGSLNGQVIEKIGGFFDTSYKDLGTDPLEMRLNPSTCELKILSRHHNQGELTISLQLGNRFGHDNLALFEGYVAGNLFGSSKISCRPVVRDLTQSLSEVCATHSSIDDEISFTKTMDVIHMLSTQTSNINSIQGVKIIEKQAYPVYKERRGSIHQ